MEIRLFATYEALSAAAARLIIDELRQKPAAVLGLATGSTPIGTYRELIRAYEAGEIDFSRAKTVNLDEYIGLPKLHPQSYHSFMQRELFSHVNLPAASIHVPDGEAADPELAAEAYEGVISELGGIDLQILGLGVNGHIGFNEPAAVFPRKTHVVRLTASTREANKRFFHSPEEVPEKAITMGIGTIMSAKTILLLVSGSSKREAVRRLLEGPVEPGLPVSILHFHHHVTLLLDKAAWPYTEVDSSPR